MGRGRRAGLWAAVGLVVAATVGVGGLAAVTSGSRPASATTQGDTITDPSNGGGPLEMSQATRAFSGGNVTVTLQTYRAFDIHQAEFHVLLDTSGSGRADYELRLGFDGVAVTGDLSHGTPREVSVPVTQPTASSIATTFPLALIAGSTSFDWAATSTFSPANTSQQPAVDWLPDAPSVSRRGGFVRVAGPSRDATAVQASFFGNGDASAVVIARDDDFADALSGVPLAAAQNAPLLLTPSSALDAGAQAELTRVLPKGKTVYLLGGTLALSAGVANAVTAAGYQVVRIAGADRFATAVAVASEGLHDPRTIFLARGDDFADALSAGPAAATEAGAVLLTDGAGLRPSTASYLSAHPSDRRVAVGGMAAQADPTAEKVVGADRYATAAQVATTFFPEPTALGLASGTAFPDGLSGGAAVAGLDAPILLSDPATLSPPAQQYLQANAAALGGEGEFAFGGSLALADAVVSAATAAAG